jgi:small subunit ribosomal protein S20
VANIASQIKRNRQNEKRRLRNKGVRSDLRSHLKAADDAVESGADDADEVVRAAMTRIDTAAAKGVIHSNEASRRKSRLARKQNG